MPNLLKFQSFLSLPSPTFFDKIRHSANHMSVKTALLRHSTPLPCRFQSTTLPRNSAKKSDEHFYPPDLNQQISQVFLFDNSYTDNTVNLSDCSNDVSRSIAVDIKNSICKIFFGLACHVLDIDIVLRERT